MGTEGQEVKIASDKTSAEDMQCGTGDTVRNTVTAAHGAGRALDFRGHICKLHDV